MDTDATYSFNNRAPEIYKAEEDQDANTEEHLLRVMASGETDIRKLSEHGSLKKKKSKLVKHFFQSQLLKEKIKLDQNPTIKTLRKNTYKIEFYFRSKNTAK